MEFRVDLEMFRGPLDLLLYLVRKHEVDIYDIPVALIAQQYALHIEVLEQLDINAVGDFLEMASTLTEIKSRMVLPRGGELEDELIDPRHDLVRQLLEYRKYKDASSMLEERGRAWQEHFARVASDAPPRERDLAEQPLAEVELWDLVSAFSRILRANLAAKPSSIVYDDTPIHVHMGRIHGLLMVQPQVAFSSLFVAGMHKSTGVGVFLAVLELVRHYHVRAEQDALFGEIWLLADAQTPRTLDPSAVDDYEHGTGGAAAPGTT